MWNCFIRHPTAHKNHLFFFLLPEWSCWLTQIIRKLNFQPDFHTVMDENLQTSTDNFDDPFKNKFCFLTRHLYIQIVLIFFSGQIFLCFRIDCYCMTYFTWLCNIFIQIFYRVIISWMQLIWIYFHMQIMFFFYSHAKLLNIGARKSTWKKFINIQNYKKCKICIG